MRQKKRNGHFSVYFFRIKSILDKSLTKKVYPYLRKHEQTTYTPPLPSTEHKKSVKAKPGFLTIISLIQSFVLFFNGRPAVTYLYDTNTPGLDLRPPNTLSTLFKDLY